MRNPTETEAAYIAGLLDGEGSICWYKQRRGRDQPMLIIVNTHYGVLEWMEQFGGRIAAKKVNGDRKPCWHWRMGRTAHVASLLEAIEPFMQIKKDKASAMLEELQSRLVETKCPVA